MAKNEYLGTKKVSIDEKMLDGIVFSDMSSVSLDIIKNSNVCYKASLLSNSKVKSRKAAYYLAKSSFIAKKIVG